MIEWLNGWGQWPAFIGAILIAALVTVGVAALVALPLRLAARKAGWSPKTLGRMRRPFRVLLFIGLLAVVVATLLPSSLLRWQATILHGLGITAIAASGWLLIGIVGFLLNRTLTRYPLDVDDNRVARRVHTQVAILRRVIFAVIVIVTAGAVLLTFPGVSGIGASLLASAGVLSVVAGIAAQSTLANVFAGLQLAFSGAIRVDDVVVVEGEYGRIEEITLTYVVVRIWDDRRFVLPSTFFATTPFENWTRQGGELTGSVEWDLDWTVSPGQIRTQLAEILAASEHWDGRSSGLQVIESTGGTVRVRATVSAASPSAVWDLRCEVREAMVEWLHREQRDALPRTRVSLSGSAEQSLDT